MDFSKIRSGVIDFSVFLVEHSLWLAATLFSVYVLIGTQLNDGFTWLANDAVQRITAPAVAGFISTYKLEGLLPFLVIFGAVFILHAHLSTLRAIGRYTPPAVRWSSIPALWHVGKDTWMGLMWQTGPKLGLVELIGMVGNKYEKIAQERYPDTTRYDDAFELLKAMALINLLLAGFGVATGRSALENLLLAGLFAALSAFTLWIDLYHRTMRSKWALQRTFAEIRAEHGNAEGVAPPRPWFDQQKKHFEDYFAHPASRRVIHFDIALPLLGSYRLFSENR